MRTNYRSSPVPGLRSQTPVASNYGGNGENTTPTQIRINSMSATENITAPLSILKAKLHVDWLSVTYSGEFPDFPDQSHWKTIASKLMTLDDSQWRISKPVNGYALAYASECGTVALSGSDGMGMHVMYSGQALEALIAQGNISIEQLLIHHASRGAKATRIDVAVDLIDGKDTLPDFQKWCDENAVYTSARTWRTLKDSKLGHTIYFGSRTSKRMVRVYNKLAERASKGIAVDAQNWVRIECEFKEDRAKMLLKATQENDISEVLIAHIKDAIDFPLSNDYQSALKDSNPEIEVVALRRKTTKTRHWLLTVVAKTLAEEAKDDLDFLSKFFTEVDKFRNMS